jgi:hypothetical protein
LIENSSAARGQGDEIRRLLAFAADRELCLRPLSNYFDMLDL